MKPPLNYMLELGMKVGVIIYSPPKAGGFFFFFFLKKKKKIILTPAGQTMN